MNHWLKQVHHRSAALLNLKNLLDNVNPDGLWTREQIDKANELLNIIGPHWRKYIRFRGRCSP